MLRKLFFLSVLLLFPSLAALAQETPQWEVFGGYSYLRVDLGPTSPLPSFDQIIGSGHVSVNGWHASIAENVTSWFGAVVDVSGHYNIQALNLTPFGFPGQTLKVNRSAYVAGGGPQVSYRRFERASLFAHALFGAVQVRAKVPTTGLKRSDNAWGMTLGGGIDVKLSSHLAVRAQADLIRTHFSDLIQNSVRVSGGLVYRIGHK